MSSDEALASRAKVLSALSADRQAILQQADAFVVVSLWQHKTDPNRAGYEYEHKATLNEALDAYREYEDGEYDRARAVGIFAVKNGMPLKNGANLDPVLMLRLMHETRRAAA